ncbi:hypothetical protein ACP3TG_09180 [Phytobacter diazotrophicus]
MKQVTMESVKQRIDDLESAGKVVGGLSLSSEFELACLRELVAVTEQRDALVVENVALKKVISDVQGVYYKSDGVAGYHLNGQIATWDEVMPDLWEIETTATDAARAALRAEGVEMFAKKCSEKSKQAISSDTRDNWWLCGEHADDFARQLRESKGEASNV